MSLRRSVCRSCGLAREREMRCPNCGRRPCTRMELTAAAALFLCVGLPCLLIGPPMWLAAGKSNLDLVALLTVGGSLLALLSLAVKRAD